MATVSAELCGRLTLFGTCASGPDFQQAHYLLMEEATTEADWLLASGTAAINWSARFIPLLADDLHMYRFTLATLGDPSTLLVDEVMDETGEDNTLPLPFSDCCVVSFTTEIPGRFGKGRRYFSPFGNDQYEVTSGVGPEWTDGLVGGMQTAWEGFISDQDNAQIADGFGQLLHYSPSLGLLAAPLVSTAHKYIGSQRRRDHA